MPPRLAPLSMDDMNETLELIGKRIHKPKYPKTPRLKKFTDPHMLELSLVDIHVGKLAWAPETGENYDVNIATDTFVKAGERLLHQARHYEVEQIVIPIGNDFYQVNNAEGTTAKGTPQDCDGRLPKMINAGFWACVKLIDVGIRVAPVKLLYVPGNHDPLTAWFLVRLLEQHYRNCDRVTVDSAPSSRKAMLYGETLVAWSHGDEEAHRDLPVIMAGEWKELWAKSVYRHWHCGHFHKRKELHTKTGDTHGAGVEVRFLPSLSASDAWHAKKGYFTNRAAEAYLYSKTRGPVGHFIVNAGSL